MPEVRCAPRGPELTGHGARVSQGVRECDQFRALLLLLLVLLTGCTGVPQGVEPVKGVDFSRYLGTWYEIVRLDHGFERGLTHVTATYSERKDGGIDVINRGFDSDSDSWRQAEGKAYFVEEPTVGHLKVSFFGPFYGSYVIAELDKAEYSYALVTGPNRDYLWILARTPALSEAVLERLVATAEHLGFATDQLIFVDQSSPVGAPEL